MATNTGGGDGESSASSIQFISATPELISLKGTGGVGLQETSTVVFKVVGLNGAALEGEEVNFKLNTVMGGVTLSKSSALSDSSGQV